MNKNGEEASATLEGIQRLQHFLKTEMTISEPEDGIVKAKIVVSNDAPAADGGSEVVFTGVGLVVIDGTGNPIRKLNDIIRVSRPSDQGHQTYDEGDWFAGTGTGGVRFPATTADETSHGQVLYPGESVLYEITVSENRLPYLDIRVEGTISRRHLFYVSRPMMPLRELALPLIKETIRGIDSIDLYSPLVALAEAIPVFSPSTTLADLEAYRGKVQTAIDHVDKTMPELNKVFHSVPNQELRDFMKQHIGSYLTTAKKYSVEVLNALSGSDMAAMKDTSDKLKAHLQTVEDVNRQKAELMNHYGIGVN